jgi:hypothetical protein
MELREIVRGGKSHERDTRIAKKAMVGRLPGPTFRKARRGAPGAERWVTLAAMLKHFRRRCAAVLAFMLFVNVSVTMAQTRPSSKPRVHARFAQAVDRVFHHGLQAKLPPHISTLLGLSQEQECSVMQNAERKGTMVRGFDVSVANKNEVVLFVVDESAKDQTLYLTSAEGRLRRVVSVKAGEGKVSRITDDDRKSFEKEKQYWVDRLAPDSHSREGIARQPEPR